MVQQLGNEDVLAAGDRVGIQPDERQQTGGGRVDTIAIQIGIFEQRRVGGAEGLQDRDWLPRVAARRINRHVDIVPQLANPLAVLAPVGQPLLPQRRLRCGKLIRGLAVIARLHGVYPRPEVFRGEARERQQQVAKIALGINRDDRDVVHGGFFEETNSQPGLTRARHADDHGMRGEVLGVIEDKLVGILTRRAVNAFTDIEGSKLLEVIHWAVLLSAVSACGGGQY